MTYVALTECCRCHTHTTDLTVNQVGHAYCPDCRDADNGVHFHAFDLATLHHDR
jgi:hypothetical protein